MYMLKGFRWGWVKLAGQEDARRRGRVQTRILELRDSSDYFLNMGSICLFCFLLVFN